MINSIKIQEKLCLSGDVITGIYGVLGRFEHLENKRDYWILQDSKTMQIFICELTYSEIFSIENAI